MKLIFILTIVFFAVKVMSQGVINNPAEYKETNWVSMMKNPNANYFETCKAFEEYWQDREIEKGCGYKVFRRWQYLTEPFVKPDGSIMSQKERALFRLKNLSSNKSANGSWVEMGPFSLPVNGEGMGRINAIAFHPTNENIIFAGAASGGLWKTTNGGESWTYLSDGFPTLGVSSIAIDPGNPNIIYIGTGDKDSGDAIGMGIFRSTDGGLTWNFSSPGTEYTTVRKIIIHPDDSQIIFAGTDYGLFKSTNGGISWTSTISINAEDFVLNPENPQIIYLTNQNTIMKSTDGGLTSVSVYTIPDSYNCVLGTNPLLPDRLYVLSAKDRTFNSFWISDDQGETFTMQSNAPNICGYSFDGSDDSGQAFYDLCMTVDPLDPNIVYVGGINVFKSNDAGITWQIEGHWSMASYNLIHADQHELVFNPLNHKLYSGNDGGFYLRNEEGWDCRSEGLRVAQCYKIGQSQMTKSLNMNGYQDNGTTFFKDNQFYQFNGGDGMECLIDYTDDNYLFGSIQFGKLYRSTDGGNIVSTIAGNGVNEINEEGYWVTPFQLDEIDPNTMFVGYTNIWRSKNVKEITDTLIEWEKITDFGPGDYYNRIRVLQKSYNGSDHLYFDSPSGGLYRIDNCNSETPIINSIPSSFYINELECSPINNDVLYAASYGTIYKSVDKGESFENITSNLSVSLIKSIVVDKQTEIIYIGTTDGVFFKPEGETNWNPFGNGLPMVSIEELEIYYDPVDPSKNRIKAATYGRGLWESDLYDDGTTAPMADFYSQNINPCPQDTVQLIDLSSFTPTSWDWTITPGTFSFVNGTDAHSKNPQIVLNEYGSYTVALTAVNSNGSSNLSKTAFLTSQPLFSEFEADYRIIYPGGKVNLMDLTSCQPDSWLWEFNPSDPDFEEGTSANSENPVISFSSDGYYTITLNAFNEFGADQNIKNNYLLVGPYYTINNDSVGVCDGTFYDSKGPDASYLDGEHYIMTLSPVVSGSKLKVVFSSFDVELHETCDFDYLKIYDGPSTSDILIGKFCGYASPGSVLSTHETGALTFEFFSDGGVVGTGWIASITCETTSIDEKSEMDFITVYPNPANNFTMITFNQTGEYFFELIDNKGKIVKNSFEKIASREYSYSLEGIGKGIYTLKISDKKNNPVFIKVVKI